MEPNKNQNSENKKDSPTHQEANQSLKTYIEAREAFIKKYNLPWREWNSSPKGAEDKGDGAL